MVLKSTFVAKRVLAAGVGGALTGGVATAAVAVDTAAEVYSVITKSMDKVQALAEGAFALERAARQAAIEASTG